MISISSGGLQVGSREMCRDWSPELSDYPVAEASGGWRCQLVAPYLEEELPAVTQDAEQRASSEPCFLYSDGVKNVGKHG